MRLTKRSLTASNNNLRRRRRRRAFYFAYHELRTRWRKVERKEYNPKSSFCRLLYTLWQNTYLFITPLHTLHFNLLSTSVRILMYRWSLHTHPSTAGNQTSAMVKTPKSNITREVKPYSPRALWRRLRPSEGSDWMWSDCLSFLESMLLHVLVIQL